MNLWFVLLWKEGTAPSTVALIDPSFERVCFTR